MTVVALLVTVLAVVAVRARRDAENLARAAIAAKLLAEGQITQGNLLLLEARKTDETATVLDSLHRALASPVETAILLGHTSRVHAASWSPDGSRVLTASNDHTARIWAVSDNYPDYLRGRIRARTRLCLEPAFHQQYLGESAAEAERRHDACEACVPRFFERLDDAPRWQSRSYEEAWGVYEECFFGRVRD